MDYERDLRIEGSIATGGGGAISSGVLLNTDLRNKYPFCADSIAIKVVFTSSEKTVQDSLDNFHQEVSVMK